MIQLHHDPKNPGARYTVIDGVLWQVTMPDGDGNYDLFRDGQRVGSFDRLRLVRQTIERWAG